MCHVVCVIHPNSQIVAEPPVFSIFPFIPTTSIVFNDTFRTNVELVRVRHFGLFVSLSSILARTD